MYIPSYIFESYYHTIQDFKAIHQIVYEVKKSRKHIIHISSYFQENLCCKIEPILK